MVIIVPADGYCIVRCLDMCRHNEHWIATHLYDARSPVLWTVSLFIHILNTLFSLLCPLSSSTPYWSWYDVTVCCRWASQCFLQYCDGSMMENWRIPTTRSVELGGCATRYLSETHLKPKSVEIWFAHNLFLNYLIILKFWTEHGSVIAMLCAKFKNDLTTEMDVMDERDFTRFEFKMSFWWISSYIAHISGYHCNGGAVYNIRNKSLAPGRYQLNFT